MHLSLYTLKTELLCDGKRIDGSSTNVGLRTLKFDATRDLPERRVDEGERSMSAS